MIIHNIGELVQGRDLYAINEVATVRELCRRLRNHNVGALAVLSEGGNLVGIISERDVAMRVVADALDPEITTVSEAMTPDPVTVDVDDRVHDALEIMLDHHFRHLPVMRDGAVAGMISIRDIPAEYRHMYERFQKAKQPLPMAAE